MGLFSLSMAAWLVIVDAPDVAFTEAVVGAGVSTIVLLGAILLTRAHDAPRTWTDMAAPALAALAAAAALLYAVDDLPAFGDASAPANAHVGRAYLAMVGEDIGAPNVVTAVLSSYRGFDTLGETAVIFAAGVGVALLLGFGERALGDGLGRAPPSLRAREEHVVLRVTAKMLIPLIVVFAFYVLFHGDLGAGGGFQAGVILAVAFILHGLVFGLSGTMRAIRPGLVRAIASLGVLVYAGLGVWTMINGGAYLDYDHLFYPEFEAMIPDSHLSGGYHHWGQHFGILGIEFGVTLTVSATMVSIFYAFAGRSADAPPNGKAGA
jgi:multicomponent Na+:H+ antiporter subunit B